MFKTMSRLTTSSSSTPPEKPTTTTTIAAVATTANTSGTTTTTTTTTTLSSLRGNNSSITSNNRICQWYCCSCGQSYGTVLYKDDYNSFQPNGEPEQHRATTLDSSNYILDNLKYYSQVVYRDHKHVLSNSTSNEEPTTNYFNCKDCEPESSSSSLSTNRNHNHNHHHHHYQPIPTTNIPSSTTTNQRKYSIENHSPDSPTFLSENPRNILSPLNIELNDDNLIDFKEKFILNIPTRFTCHRCSHMMCPYCPKLRLKDLH